MSKGAASPRGGEGIAGGSKEGILGEKGEVGCMGLSDGHRERACESMACIGLDGS